MYLYRSTYLYEKNLDDSQAFTRIRTYGRQIYDFEAFGGSFYYHTRSFVGTPFTKDGIVKVESDNFVFVNPAAFKDITFMHHSLQPGE